MTEPADREGLVRDSRLPDPARIARYAMAIRSELARIGVPNLTLGYLSEISQTVIAVADQEQSWKAAWEDNGWWRVIETSTEERPDRLWCETSNKQEAREALKECPYPARLECGQRRTEQRWVAP